MGVADGIGSLIGNMFGSSNVNDAIASGQSQVGGLTQLGAQQVAPYNEVGAAYLGPTAENLLGTGVGSSEIGQGRINDPNQPQTPTYDRVGALPNYAYQNTGGDPVNFEDFAKNYNMSEGAQYLMDTAGAAQNSSAAAKGGLLSGANLRAQTGIAEGIANQDLLAQYQAHNAGQQQGFNQQLAGSNQQMAAQQQQFAQDYGAYDQGQRADQQDFQQRETSYQNMYGQEAMGLQAGTAEAGTFAQGARALGSLAQTQATAAQQQSAGFGSALGSIFKGIASLIPGASLFT